MQLTLNLAVFFQMSDQGQIGISSFLLYGEISVILISGNEGSLCHQNLIIITMSKNEALGKVT